jgi:tetratricopeptide (TPR) repeat protein
MTQEALLKQIERWHEAGKHEKIAETLSALPEKERNYDLTCLLARALNNLSRYEEALGLLESVRDRGGDDALWHFRMGYSLYYLSGREVEAIPYLERAIELGDDWPSTYELLLWARSFAQGGENAEEADADDETGGAAAADFIPKAYACLSLNMRLQPQDRAKIFEDGLDFMLRSRNLGCISGGGTLLSSEGEPASCDINIDLADDSEETRQSILSIAQKLEVARGSSLLCRSDCQDKDASEESEYPIGNLEGFAVYLNRTDLPDATYENNNVNEVVDRLLALLGDNGALVWSYWNGPTEIALYFYGEGGFDFMLEKAAPLLNEHPLCQKCRIVRIA